MMMFTDSSTTPKITKVDSVRSSFKPKKRWLFCYIQKARYMLYSQHLSTTMSVCGHHGQFQRFLVAVSHELQQTFSSAVLLCSLDDVQQLEK